MAATYLESWKLANFVDPTETPDAEDFRRKIQIAIVRAAKQIAGESQGSFRSKHWVKRAVLATNILGTQIIDGTATSVFDPTQTYQLAATGPTAIVMLMILSVMGYLGTRYARHGLYLRKKRLALQAI